MIMNALGLCLCCVLLEHNVVLTELQIGLRALVRDYCGRDYAGLRLKLSSLCCDSS